jgi:diguanylate cyclase (GGDEF)-like protein
MVIAWQKAVTDTPIGRLPVVDQGALVGMVTREDLLKELGRLTDPLTDLPWSVTLRQKAADLLKAGREISVLFIDLDDFAFVNKLYGHVVGDRIIKSVAALLREKIDPESDVICRYAGDEFAIVTTRTVDSAMALALVLREAIAATEVPGAPLGAVSAAIGIGGGKRSIERHDIHHDATVDDLLTIASRASTMAKRTEARILHKWDPFTYKLLDIGQSGDAATRLALHDREVCWERSKPKGSTLLFKFAAMPSARFHEGDRRTVECCLRAENRQLPCGTECNDGYNRPDSVTITNSGQFLPLQANYRCQGR